ncbi:hypothetical protein ACO0M4_29165 [Streptomyces sp. RGM 3693]|uniref:hypothetical protein n=1 Tax=Streptomyces sp. RGM 3693 TaxID=3413284 RepID=UPI003D2A6DEF
MNKMSDAVVATLEAAARLLPSPGYINGDDYDQWYVEATPSLLVALAELARSQDAHELADRLDRLSHPLCMEPLDAVLTTNSMPKRWCFNPVKAAGTPCELHKPERAVDLGRCTWAGSDTERICRSTPNPGDDRCKEHAAFCRAIKTDGAVCNRHNCSVPKHRQAAVSAAH